MGDICVPWDCIVIIGVSRKEAHTTLSHLDFYECCQGTPRHSLALVARVWDIILDLLSMNTVPPDVVT